MQLDGNWVAIGQLKIARAWGIAWPQIVQRMGYYRKLLKNSDHPRALTSLQMLQLINQCRARLLDVIIAIRACAGQLQMSQHHKNIFNHQWHCFLIRLSSAIDLFINRKLIVRCLYWSVMLQR